MGRFIDLTGVVFSRLTVLDKAENSINGHARWLCRCECGNERVVIGDQLRSGRTQSCGCLAIEKTKQRNVIDITGNRYGCLLVLRRVSNGANRFLRWECQCDCGNITVVIGNNLKRGHTQSCGCMLGLNRLQLGEAAFNKLAARLRKAAKQRGYVWGLNNEQIMEITKQNCYYCGVEPLQITKTKGYGDYIYNGIDRIDNTKGYLIDNVVSCCRYCNWCKRDKMLGEFKEWVRIVYGHFASK